MTSPSDRLDERRRKAKRHSSRSSGIANAETLTSCCPVHQTLGCSVTVKCSNRHLLCFSTWSTQRIRKLVAPLAQELEPRGIGVLPLHPGCVRTGIGGLSAPLNPGESGRGMLALGERCKPNPSGGFFRFDGARMPW